MVKIRLQGTLEELEATKQSLENVLAVCSVSIPYKDRGKTEYWRIYLDCEEAGFTEQNSVLLMDEINKLIEDIENTRHLAAVFVNEEFNENGINLDYEYMRGRMCAFEDVLAKLRKITI